ALDVAKDGDAVALAQALMSDLAHLAPHLADPHRGRTVLAVLVLASVLADYEGADVVLPCLSHLRVADQPAACCNRVRHACRPPWALWLVFKTVQTMMEAGQAHRGRRSCPR